MRREHDLSLVPEKYRHIAKTLLEWEDSLSDGFGYYCNYVASEQAHEFYNGDEVLAALVEITKEILGEDGEDGA